MLSSPAAITVQGPTAPPTPTQTLPTIIGEKPLFTRKLNKRHKPVGKPVLSGFELQFSTAMNPTTAGSPNNYQVAWMSVKRVKKKTVKLVHPISVTAQYDSATDAVTLLLSQKQTFAKGGQITAIAASPNGVSSAAGILLDGNDEGTAGDDGVFTIMPRASGIVRGS